MWWQVGQAIGISMRQIITHGTRRRDTARATRTRRGRARGAGDPPPLNSLSKRRDFYSRAVISRVGMPSSSTYQSPMIILIAGNTPCRSE
jgi:hypothetical protein